MAAALEEGLKVRPSFLQLRRSTSILVAWLDSTFAILGPPPQPHPSPRAAVPHPQVADDKLYRSTDASDPIAKRLRSIVSWAAQRTRDRIFRGVREDEMSVAQSAAKGVIDAFIEDVCSLRVDTSVPYQVRGALPSSAGVCSGSKRD